MEESFFKYAETAICVLHKGNQISSPRFRKKLSSLTIWTRMPGDSVFFDIWLTVYIIFISGIDKLYQEMTPEFPAITDTEMAWLAALRWYPGKRETVKKECMFYWIRRMPATCQRTQRRKRTCLLVNVSQSSESSHEKWIGKMINGHCDKHAWRISYLGGETGTNKITEVEKDHGPHSEKYKQLT